ncbi:MAG: glycosyltransferase [Acidimicrobiaceae bacterium]|nr:glycosyltransferase [Acidimicrobiaceae bacterium]
MRPGREGLVLTAGWLAGFALLARLPGLTRRTGAHTDPEARLSVVIPARNEEGNLGRLLGSLARQRPSPAEVIVVDDRSSDATAGLARRAGATVLVGAETPPGWSGKCWACHQGAKAAEGSRLVFLDADVTLSPDALWRLVGEHDRRGGLVSVAPFHRTERGYERLSAVANLVALMGTGAFAVLPGSPAMAFGPCMITGADDYRRVGGHAHPEVRGEVAEDVALAGRFRALGLPVSVLAGREAVTFRMYPDGPRQLIEGWTRLLASGAERTPLVLRAAIGLWITAALTAASGLLHARRSRTALAWYGAFSLQMWWMLRRVGRFGPLSALAFPLPLSTFVALFARSAWHRLLGRPPIWRGRRMPATVSRSRS